MTNNIYEEACNYLIEHGDWTTDGIDRLMEAGRMEVVAYYKEEVECGLDNGYACQNDSVYSEDDAEITNYCLPYYGRYDESFEDVVRREVLENGYSETLEISIEDCMNPKIDFSNDRRVLEYLQRLQHNIETT